MNYRSGYMALSLLFLAGACSLNGTGPDVADSPDTASAPVTPAAAAPEQTTEPAPEAVASAQPQTETAQPDKPAPQTKTEIAASPPVTQAPAPVTTASKEPNHFHVTLAKKDASHPQFGVGHDMSFAVDGVPGKEVNIERGKAYFFDVDTNVQHDFYLSTNSVGWGSGVFTNGVKGHFTYNGTVTVNADQNTPAELYYQCRNHKAMGWKIHVLNKGEKPSMRTAANMAQPPKGQTEATVSASQVEQKIQYAKMLTTQSAIAKRVSASNHAKAQEMMKKAKQLLEQSQQAMAQKQLVKAGDLVDESLRTVSAASREVPAQRTLPAEELQQQYDEHIASLKTYRESYERTLKRAEADKKGQAVVVRVDLKEIDRQTQEAQSLRGQGKMQEANQKLADAQLKLTGALNKMLASQTVVYDLTFDSPREEYEYESARYESYRELIPLAIEHKQPNEQVLKLMRTYEQQAKEIFAKAAGFTKSGDYKTAVQGIQEATETLRRALRLVGV